MNYPEVLAACKDPVGVAILDALSKIFEKDMQLAAELGSLSICSLISQTTMWMWNITA